MGYPIPKQLKGHERLLTIPYLNIYLNKKGVLYCGIASALAAVIGKLSNVWVFGSLFLILNLIAYPLAQFKVNSSKFDCGNLNYDIYLYRKLRYKRKRNIYMRRRGN